MNLLLNLIENPIIWASFAFIAIYFIYVILWIKYHYLNYMYHTNHILCIFMVLVFILIIIACIGYKIQKPNSSKLNRYKSLKSYYSIEIKSDKFCRIRDSHMLHIIYSNKLLHKNGMKFLIIPGTRNKFITYKLNHTLSPKMPKDLLIYYEWENIFAFPVIHKYDFNLPFYNNHNYDTYVNKMLVFPVGNFLYNHSFFIKGISQLHYKIYIRKTNSIKYLKGEKAYVSYIIPSLRYKRRLVDKKLKHAKDSYLLRYTNMCNFKIFIYLLIDLICLSILSIIFVLIKPVITSSASLYGPNIINVFLELLKCYNKEILDNYVFKIIPLVIAIMSGVVIVYIKFPTRGWFVFLVKYTIPILSCFQFIRSSNKIFNTLIKIFKNY